MASFLRSRLQLLRPMAVHMPWATRHVANGSGSTSQVDYLNEIFSALGLRIMVVTPSSHDAHVNVRVVREAAADDGKGVVQSALDPHAFVSFMQGARAEGAQNGMAAGMDLYVQRMFDDGRLKHIPWLPQAFERKLYVDVAKVMVFVWHSTMDMLSSVPVGGHKLRVEMIPQSIPNDSRRKKLHIGEPQIRACVDRMLKSEAVNMLWVPDFIERKVYVNAIMVVMQLLDDFVAGDDDEITCLGHTVRLRLRKQPIRELINMLNTTEINYCRIDEVVLGKLTDELLEDSDVNLKWMPDAVEREIYVCVLSLMIRVLEEVLCRLQIRVLSRDIEVQILGPEDVKSQAQQLKVVQEKSQSNLYSAEPEPLKTIDSFELEQRLKDIDEERRILEGIKQMGGAFVDLTAETPIIQRKIEPVGESVKATDPVDSTELSQTMDANVVDGAEEKDETHEFVRLAHSLKLGRSMGFTTEIEADIQHPYNLIGDVETYPLWMPWCAAGKALGNRKELTPDNRRGVYDGEVGFGFDTGTFLGVLGDTVSYRITLDAPAQVVGADTKGSPDSGKVRAACEGFAYGEKLIWDWRFTEIRPGVTKCELDMLFQAKSVLYLPLWDSLKDMVVEKLLVSFKARCEALQKQGASATRE